MPRVVKKERLVELNLDGPPVKLTRKYLLGLNRGQIQTLAKRYDIKANEKTESIITKLLVKEEPPEGRLALDVAVRKTGQQTTQNQRIRTRSSNLATDKGPVPVIAPVTPEASDENVSLLQEVVESDASSTDSGDTHIDKSRLSRRRATPYLSKEEREALKKRGGSIKRLAKETEAPYTSHLLDPTVKDVRKVRRLLASLNEARLEMRREIETTRSTLAYAEQNLATGREGIKALSWRRELYERDIVSKMKTDRTLWDGTAHMRPKQRREWAEFVGANWERPVNHHDASSSAEEIEGDDAGDGDNEMSDDDAKESPGRSVPLQAAPQEALEEVDYDWDNIYVNGSGMN